MSRTGLLLGVILCAMCAIPAAVAGNLPQHSNETLTIEQASQYFHYSSGNDRYRVEVAPNYSEELGFSLKGAAGAYLSDEIALGLIVEYGENKREYLANAGLQFDDTYSLVGTVGLLEEAYEYVDGGGDKTVRQMEYGASLKGTYEVGIISGLELNGYLTNASASSDSVETGQLYGVQLLADLTPTDTTHVTLGGGYEWLEWEDGGASDSFAFSAAAVQQIGAMLSLTGNVKLGASEYVYGGGLAFDLSNGGANTNSLALRYSYIDGQDGINDDQRVELSWTYGFGAGPTRTASVEAMDHRAIRPAADVVNVAPANGLLGDVTKRPSYLPQTVIGRSRKSGNGSIQDCATAGILVIGFQSRLPNVFDVADNPDGPDFVLLEMRSPASPTSVKLMDVPLANSLTLWGVSMEFPGAGTYTLDVDGVKCLLAANYLE